jgi:hypothetical protein
MRLNRFLFAALVIVGALAIGNIAMTNKPAQPIALEYKILTSYETDSKKLEEFLNEWGKEGWDIVAVNVIEGGPTGAVRREYVLKHLIMN